MVLSEIEKRLADKHPGILRDDINKILQIILLINGAGLIEVQNFHNFIFLKVFYIFIKKQKIKNFMMR